MEKTLVVPAKFLEITENKALILCNIGTLEYPYLQERWFDLEPLREITKDYPPKPDEKYCVITVTSKPGRMDVHYDVVIPNDEFKQNFVVKTS